MANITLPHACPHGGKLTRADRFTTGQCAVCWPQHFGPPRSVPVYRTADEAIAAAPPEPPRPPERPADCVHLGKIVARTNRHALPVICAGQWLRVCDTHGACTVSGDRPDVANCQRCGQYHSAKREDEPAGEPVPAVLPHDQPSLDEVHREIAGPERPRPDGWAGWPVVSVAHQQALRRHLAALPPVPPIAGDGCIYCGGGKYDLGLYLSIRMLRESGCDLPVQVWHRGDGEPVSAAVRGLGGVTVIDAERHPLRPTWRVLGGWQLKMIAVLNSGFARVLYQDADNYAVGPVPPLFTLLDAHPALLWPDIPDGDGAIHWKSYGCSPDAGVGTNGGSAMYDVARSWPALRAAHWLDMHSEWSYKREHGVGGYGDQDQVRAGFRLTDTPFKLMGDRPYNFDGIFHQVGATGSTTFVHRIWGKPAPPGAFPTPFVYRPNIPGEHRLWELAGEYRA